MLGLQVVATTNWADWGWDVCFRGSSNLIHTIAISSNALRDSGINKSDTVRFWQVSMPCVLCNTALMLRYNVTQECHQILSTESYRGMCTSFALAFSC